MVIILLIVVFDPLAVILLIAGNISMAENKKPEPPKVLDPKPKRKYNRRKPLASANSSVHVVEDDTFGIESTNVPEPVTPWVPTRLRPK